MLNLISAFKFSISLSLAPRFNVSHLETVNFCNFLCFYLCGRLWARIACSENNLEDKGRKLRWDGFKIGVAATLPELSEWALIPFS